jgi:hypothetical protein
MYDLIYYCKKENKADVKILETYRNIFDLVIVAHDKKDIFKHLQTITNITLVISKEYFTYALQDLKDFINNVSTIKNYDVIILAPYRLLCAQLTKSPLSNIYPVYNISGFNCEQLHFRAELFYPSIKNKIGTLNNLKALTLLPNLFNYDMKKITQLSDFNNNDLCINYTVKKEKEKAYILLIIFFFIIILLLIWYFLNYSKKVF